MKNVFVILFTLFFLYVDFKAIHWLFNQHDEFSIIGGILLVVPAIWIIVTAGTFLEKNIER